MDSPSSQQYLSLLDAFNLHQIVTEQTRISLRTLSLIDHIITSNLYIITSVSVVSNHSISDHSIISCELTKSEHEAVDSFTYVHIVHLRNDDKFLADL